MTAPSLTPTGTRTAHKCPDCGHHAADHPRQGGTGCSLGWCPCRVLASGVAVPGNEQQVPVFAARVGLFNPDGSRSTTSTTTPKAA